MLKSVETALFLLCIYLVSTTMGVICNYDIGVHHINPFIIILIKFYSLYTQLLDLSRCIELPISLSFNKSNCILPGDIIFWPSITIPMCPNDPVKQVIVMTDYSADVSYQCYDAKHSCFLAYFFSASAP